MTKQEIIDKYADQLETWKPERDIIEDAIEEFGKIHAIEFIKWGISSGNITSEYHGSAIILPDTEEELYTQFIKHQQQNML